MIKNISRGILLSGLLVAIYPLVAAVFMYVSSLVTGYGLNPEWNSGVMALVLTLPVGMIISFVGFVLLLLLSKLKTDSVSKEGKINYVIVLLTAVSITIVVLFVAKIIPGSATVSCDQTTDIRTKCR